MAEARQGPQPVSRRLSAIRRCRRDPRAGATELYAEPAEYFYGRCLHIDPRFAGPPGYATEETQRRGIKGMVSQAADASRDVTRYETKFQMLAREMDAIVEKGYVIIGSPDEVVEQLSEVATNLNVGHLMMLLQFGNMGKDLAKYNTKLFAEKVMPQLTDMFAEWEDRWWPQPMNREARAAADPVPAGGHGGRVMNLAISTSSPPRKRGSQKRGSEVPIASWVPRLRGDDGCD